MEAVTNNNHDSSNDSEKENKNNNSCKTDAQIPCNKKVALMRSAIQTTTDQYVASMKLGWFGKAYPELYRHRREELRALHQVACSQLKSNLDTEIEEVLEEQDLIPKIARLDEIRQQNIHRKGTVAWRPSTNTALDLEDHFKIPQLEHLERLQAYLQVLKAKNDELEEKVLHGRTELEQNNKEIYSKTLPFIKINETIQKLDLLSLESVLEKNK